MQKSQELLENKDVDGALEILTSLIESDKLSDYEKSNVYRYIGFTYHSAGDIEAAINAFEKVLGIPGLEERITKDTLYTLAQ